MKSIKEATEQEKIIALAELDGYTFWSVPYFTHDGKWHREPFKGNDWHEKQESAWAGEPSDVQDELDKLPFYLTSYDAILPLIQKHVFEMRLKVSVVIHGQAFHRENFGSTGDAFMCLKPNQYCDALLIAANKFSL